ncbi:NUDIX hydrolase [Pseudolysinimonas sp.]|uniref:NUDIX hydrolase n=1 Tax=Pseudolysinimonas sp. TaxID=2680009 RepID=UPI003F8103D5
MSRPTPPVLAAGAVCWREGADGAVEILLVHRTQHRDTSLPKGKVDPGETLPETAVREIAEETGLLVGLGAPLGVVAYTLPSGRPKEVSYWAAEVEELAIANSTFTSNDEIERLSWVTLRAARKALTYPHDVDIVERFAQLYERHHARTFAIIALRHGKAVPAEHWDGPDATRPLLQRGIDQALSVAPGIAAFRPERLYSSPAERCVSTVAPTSRITGLEVRLKPGISQDAYDASGAAVSRIVGKRLRRRRSAVLCSHGPVLPQIVAAAAVGTDDRHRAELGRAAQLGTGEYAVVHIAVEHPEAGPVAVEVHSPTA